MIASLMMYDRPEIATEHAAYWALIRAALARRGIEAPKVLSNDAPEFDVWRAPDLVLSQTCGLPYRAFLADDVTLVGTPDFANDGCPPGFYNSAVVVRADDPRECLTEYSDARFVFNQGHSQSGYAAMYHVAQARGFWFSDMQASGGHLASARMVAEGAADIAAIDAQTWHYARQFDRFTDDLRVLEWTPPTPSLPYITGANRDGNVIFDAVSEAIDQLDTPTRALLNLRGMVRISKADYLAVPTPPLPA